MGFSLKLYFDRAMTMAWTGRLVEALTQRPELTAALQVWVAPATPFLSDVHALCDGSPVRLAAQNVDGHGRGAFTGGVCAEDLADVGVSRVVIGHAERRALGETEDMVAAKVKACLRARLEPVLCVGEPERVPAAAAAEQVLTQIRSARVPAGNRWTIAYEPVWAIGASAPAGAEHVKQVCAMVRASHPGAAVVYGGSARPGLLQDLRPEADGLFLGRFAHDTSSFAPLVDDVAAALGSTDSSASGAGASGSARS